MTEHDGLQRSSKLLPCPFCGGEARLVEGEYGMYLTGYAVYCNGTCGAKLGVKGRLCEAYEWTPYFETEAEAIAAWNSRPREAELQAALNKAAGNWARAELTCHDVNKDDHDFTCSECGAKVVEQ